MKKNIEAQYANGNIYDIEIASLNPNSNQPRKYFDADSLEGLKKSILVCGLIQPISFTVKNGELVIVAGERRWRAFCDLGIESIQAKYVSADLAPTVAIVENLQRDDLGIIEKAEAIQIYKEQNNFSLGQLSKKLGKPVSSLSEFLSLNRLPDEIKEKCRCNNRFSLTRLVQIAKVKELATMHQLFAEYKNEVDGEKAT